jgi:hypothetical protein
MRSVFFASIVSATLFACSSSSKATGDASGDSAADTGTIAFDFGAPMDNSVDMAAGVQIVVSPADAGGWQGEITPTGSAMFSGAPTITSTDVRLGAPVSQGGSWVFSVTGASADAGSIDIHISWAFAADADVDAFRGTTQTETGYEFDAGYTLVAYCAPEYWTNVQTTCGQ